LSFFNIDLKADLDDDLIAETESNHVGFSLYVTARF